MVSKIQKKKERLLLTRAKQNKILRLGIHPPRTAECEHKRVTRASEELGPGSCLSSEVFFSWERNDPSSVMYYMRRCEEGNDSHDDESLDKRQVGDQAS